MSVELTPEFLKRAIQQRPDYATLYVQTREALASYFEGDALRLQIQSYPKEDLQKFEFRRERMLDSYDNYVKEIAELYVEGVFRVKQPARKTNNKNLDVYLNGDFADWFLQDVAPFALFLPELYIVCDVPTAKGIVTSAADQSELQGLPYPVILFPQYCCNFGFNESGDIAWITFFDSAPPELVGRDTTGKPIPSPGGTKQREAVRYKIYTDTHYVIVDADGNPVAPFEGAPAAPIEHGYGFLPVVRVTYRANLSAQDSKRTGYAFMHSIVKIALGGLTAKGVLHDFQYYSLFPKLVMTEDTADVTVESGMAADSIITVPGTDAAAKVKPYYLEVPIREFEALERISYERIPSAAYRAARLRDRTTQKSGKVAEQSGLSKMFDMVPELGVLKSIAKFFQCIDLSVTRMLAQMAGVKNIDSVTAEYPSTFDTKSISEMMTELVEFGDAIAKTALPSSETAAAILSERAYRALLPDLSDREYKVIVSEIEQALQALKVPLDDVTAVTDDDPTETQTQPFAA